MKKESFLVIGVTGGLGMGKTTAAKLCESFGFERFDADAFVRQILDEDKAVISKIAKVFPQSRIRGKIDRSILFSLAFRSEKEILALEEILHPLVWKARDKCLEKARLEKRRGVVLDIPLLFETGAEKGCDKVLCVHTRAEVQRRRALRRKGMTLKKLKALTSRQWPSAKKRRLADACLNMELSKKDVREKLCEILTCWDKAIE